MFETLNVWVVSVMTALGYPGLALVMFLENVFPPIPSEIVLPLAGSLTIDGPFHLAGVTAVGAVGSVGGAWFFYGLGRWFDEARLRVLIQRFGKWFMLSEDDLDRAIAWFHRYGEWTVFFGRMVPIVRSLISVPAGMAKMSGWKFTFYTTLGTALWSLALALAGRLLGQSWPLVADFVDRFQWVTLIVIAAVVLGFLAGRWYRRARAQERKG